MSRDGTLYIFYVGKNVQHSLFMRHVSRVNRYMPVTLMSETIQCHFAREIQKYDLNSADISYTCKRTLKIGVAAKLD